jgi:cytochrome c553
MRHAELVVGLCLLIAAGVASAADAEKGRLLYETHCGGCHYERVHDRKTSTVDSLAKLRAEIAKWAQQTGRRFTPEELDDIAAHLNRTHYRLEK